MIISTRPFLKLGTIKPSDGIDLFLFCYFFILVSFELSLSNRVNHISYITVLKLVLQKIEAG